MENTRPQPCGQAHVQDAFHLEAVRDDAGRKALFARMCREGLTGCAMYAWPHPREDDWLHLVSAPGRLLLQATAPGGTALACGLFSPWRGRIREFDFTVFRTAFPLAVPLARAAFRWVFRHTETSALWGLCPVSNRHAWRLATACGFVITGRLLAGPARRPHGRHPAALHAGDAGARHKDVSIRPQGPSVNNLHPQGGHMGFGGSSSPSVPEVQPAPKAATPKPVTEAATAARQNQKDKASKAAGIRASIHTTPLASQENRGKTLLGQ